MIFGECDELVGGMSVRRRLLLLLLLPLLLHGQLFL